jgi:hypothetical protein
MKMKKNMRLLMALLLVFGLLAMPAAALAADPPTITQPNGGEFLGRGSEYTVEWTDNNTSTFEFYLSTDSGANYNINLGSGSGGSFTFTVPQITTSTARIKMSGIIGIRDLGMGMKVPVFGSDESDANFSMGYMLIPIGPIVIIAYPAAPTNLEVGTDISIFTHDLTWEDESFNETGFKIFRRHESSLLSVLVATVGADVTSYTDTAALTTGDTYYYKLYAYNGFGNSSYSNTYEYEVLGLIMMPLYPAAPTNLEVGTDGSLETHDLTWEDNSSNESGFKIYRKLGSSLMWALIDTIGSDETSYEDESTLTVGETYYYRVAAYNSFDDSEFSNSVEYMVADPEPEPEPEPEPSVTPVTIDLIIGETTYQVDGVDHEMDVAAMVIDGRTLLPVRYIADPLGAGVGWVGSEQKATVTLGGIYLELWIDNPIARINGVDTQIDAYNADVAPIIVPPGRTMLPLRFIAEALGCQVNYDGATQSIEVIHPAP